MGKAEGALKKGETVDKIISVVRVCNSHSSSKPVIYLHNSDVLGTTVKNKNKKLTKKVFCSTRFSHSPVQKKKMVGTDHNYRK